MGLLSRGSHTLEVALYDAPEFGGDGVLIGHDSIAFSIGEPRMSIVYENRLPASEILAPGTTPRALSPNRGGHRQVGRTTLSPWGVSKLNGRVLANQSAREMADAVERAVGRACGSRPGRRPPTYCRGSGLVAIDELTPA